jgi:hypothetical protein
MRLHRIGERRKIVGVEPGDVRREPDESGRDRRPWRRRAEIGGAAPIGERGQRQTEQQHDRPVLAEHRGRRRQAGERGEHRTARLVGAQKQRRGRRPQRDHHRVGVELQRMEIEERHQGEQRQPHHPFLGVEVAAGDIPGDPQRERGQHHGEQIVGPVGERKDAEPGADQPGAERRMLRRAPERLARPGDHLAHVEVDVLAALGDRAVERPQRAVGGEHRHDGALAPRRSGERRNQAIEHRADADAGRRGHCSGFTSALNVVRPRDIT